MKLKQHLLYESLYTNNLYSLNRTTFYCPSPLVYAYEDKYFTEWAYQTGNCTIPCPTVTFTSTEWNSLAQVCEVLAYITCITSLSGLVYYAKDFKKFFIRFMFLSGFVLYSFMLSIFFSANHDDALVCAGDNKEYYVKKNPLCVVQAAVQIFSFLWIDVWSVILTIDTYYQICSAKTNSPEHIAQMHRRYLGVALAVSLGMTSIPLIAGNIGFDPEQNVPLCLYLFSEVIMLLHLYQMYFSVFFYGYYIYTNAGYSLFSFSLSFAD
jgi:hypothetical protein